MDYPPSPHASPVIMHSNAYAPTVAGPAGNYRVIRLLGRGTMSSVYLAEQISMARPVALKILSPALASDPEFVERFLREARASARLNHPNIVSAIDFGEFESRFFLAMEFVDGSTLSALLEKDGNLEESRVLGIGLQVISALEHAASHNVIHLDVKPANIMICKDGRVKLADFGLAVIMDTPGQAEASRRAMGTPYYMAPEQVDGGKLDWRTDQYSLGASLYEAVTGRKPFQGDNVRDILAKRFFEKPEPAWRTGRKRAGRGFSAVLAKMLARPPGERYQSFAELKEDFHRVQSGTNPVVARISSVVASNTPKASAWNSFGYASVLSRVDGMLWRQRWNWFIYSSLLFLVVLAAYGLAHFQELMGPVPPRMSRYELVTEAENLPPDISSQVRESWKGAEQMFYQAEKEPTSDNIRRALYAYNLIVGNKLFVDTAYITSTRRRIAYLRIRLLEGPERHADPLQALGDTTM